MATTNKLPRALTLKSSKEIEQLLKNGHRKTENYCTVIWEFAESFRYAVLLSGKIRKAVTRNRIKRLFREAIRLNRKSLTQPVNIAFLVRTIANEPGFKDINTEVADAFAFISNQPS